MTTVSGGKRRIDDPALKDPGLCPACLKLTLCGVDHMALAFMHSSWLPRDARIGQSESILQVGFGFNSFGVN